jgi:hypothetical protein
LLLQPDDAPGQAARVEVFVAPEVVGDEQGAAERLRLGAEQLDVAAEFPRGRIEPAQGRE